MNRRLLWTMATLSLFCIILTLSAETVSKASLRQHPQLTERIWDAIWDVQGSDVYKKMLKK